MPSIDARARQGSCRRQISKKKPALPVRVQSRFQRSFNTGSYSKMPSCAFFVTLLLMLTIGSRLFASRLTEILCFVPFSVTSAE
ncbi:hypothetical protein [Ensifer canadensis]